MCIKFGFFETEVHKLKGDITITMSSSFIQSTVFRHLADAFLQADLCPATLEVNQVQFGGIPNSRLVKTNYPPKWSCNVLQGDPMGSDPVLWREQLWDIEPEPAKCCFEPNA